ncbi:MAG: HAD family hydrolase [Bacteroidota bacterium]
MKRLFLVLPIVISLLYGCKKKEDPLISVYQATTLTGNWDPFNKLSIENLINTYGKRSSTYNASKPPYAIFDWDNTCSFWDTEEATLIYQLANLKFGCTPAELDSVIRTGVDTNTVFTGSVVTFAVKDIAKDIKASYTWLYNNYSGLGGGGTLSLDDVKTNPNYSNFITKVRWLYDGFNTEFGENISYTYIFFLYYGLTEAQIRQMVKDAASWQLTQNIGKITWTSPNSNELPGQYAGQLSTTWKNGLRFFPEQVELYNKLRDAGFDVWICTASLQEIISAVSSSPLFGFNNDFTHCLGMKAQYNNNGKLINKLVTGAPFTFQSGKTDAIRAALSGPTGKYGYDPLFIAGDSDGDQNMLSDFPGMKMGLIINRNKGAGELLGTLCSQAVSTYNTPSAKYLLQGRDDNNGQFISSQAFIAFGSTTGVVLP